ncbi:MAG: cytochrome c [Deltaproteobacteria bacterium]|nr:cytochrome c [Deltaproteobacteria bacterium]
MPTLKTAAALLLLATPALAEVEVKDLWAKKCQGCHAMDGSGDTERGRKYKVDDLTDPGWQARHSDEKIEKAIFEGKGKVMKPFKDRLTPEEIAALVRHVRTFKRP